MTSSLHWRDKRAVEDGDEETTVQTEAAAEYGRTVIQIAGEDVRQVYLRVTGILGLAVVFLTQLPFDELAAVPLWARWVFIVGLAAAGGSAACYFRYLSTLHLARLEMAEYARDGKAAAVGQIWSGDGTFWNENRWLFMLGTAFGLASVGMLGVTLGTMLHLVP